MAGHKSKLSESSPLVQSINPPPTPSKFRSYFELTRLHKWPLGNDLIIWPAIWGLAMASYKSELPLSSLAIPAVVCVLGGTLLHSAACVINDICDVDFDRQVERTKYRPLVVGSIPMIGAWALLAAFTAATFSVLLLVNPTAALCGVLGIFPFHAFYPLMKRVTWWPQAWLGFAMNWSFPTAWLYVCPSDLSIALLPMPGLIAWTIIYDTIYACQDREDDAKAGIKSTALLFGTWVKPILGFFSVIFTASLVYAGFMNGQGWAYYVIACGGAMAHTAWQLITVDLDNRNDCGAKFKSNGKLGMLICVGILVDYYIQRGL